MTIDTDMVCDFIGSMTEEQIRSLAEQLTEQHEGKAQFLLEQIQRVRNERDRLARQLDNDRDCGFFKWNYSDETH